MLDMISEETVLVKYNTCGDRGQCLFDIITEGLFLLDIIADWRDQYLETKTETKTGGQNMSLVVLPVRPRPRFMAPWSYKQERKGDFGERQSRICKGRV